MRTVLKVQVGDYIRCTTGIYGEAPIKGEVGLVVRVGHEDGGCEDADGNSGRFIDIKFPSDLQEQWLMYDDEFEHVRLVVEQTPLSPEEQKEAKPLPSHNDLTDFFNL